MFRYYNWEEVNINWEALDINWEEVGILIDVISAGGGGGVSGLKKPANDFLRLKELNKLPEEKKRKIIKLVCKISGNDKEYISYKYKNENIKITAEHVSIIIDEVLKNKIKVDVQNIS